ncbi:ribonuclease H-like domain-containing protein [Tanacetum coccineum]
MHTFYQRHRADYHWTKDHPLEQVRRNPSKRVQTRRQLATNPEMCMFTLSVSTAKSKNIKEAMADPQPGLTDLQSTEEKVYVSLARTRFDVRPEQPEKVYHLRKALYGLKQAPRAWYDELLKFLISKGFSKEVLKKHKMDKCDSIGTLMATSPKLDADLSDTPVQHMLLVHVIPSSPTEKHLKEVKRIFRYLKQTINMGLWYPKDSGFELIAFSDADHAGCLDTCKSTSRGIQFLEPSLPSGAPTRCSICLIRQWFVCEEVRIPALELILTFPYELCPSSGIPSNLDNGNANLLELLYLLIYDLYRLFDKFNLSSSRISSSGMIRLSSDKHFFKFET